MKNINIDIKNTIGGENSLNSVPKHKLLGTSWKVISNIFWWLDRSLHLWKIHDLIENTGNEIEKV